MSGETINAAKLSDLNICNLTPVVDTIEQSVSQYRFRITPRIGGLGATIVYVNNIEVKRFTPQQLQQQKDYYLLSVDKKELVYELNHWEIKAGDVCEVGSQLRPHIVWFGEDVPEMEKATSITEEADIFITIGTSLNVYPAANLIHVVKNDTPKFLVDPGDFNLDYVKNLTVIKANAIEGMTVLSKKLNELI